MDSLPHQPGQPAPYIFAAPGEQQPDSSFDFWGVLNRRKWLVFLGLVSGMALGALYDAQCETIYESVARVKIEPKDPLYIPMSPHDRSIMPGATDMMVRHDQLIGQPNIVARCLNENKLNNLRSFEGIGQSDVVDEVRNNLLVEQNREEPILYELTFKSKDPEDAQMILSNLIATYESNLEDQYKTKTTKVTTLLRELEKKFDDEYTSLQKRLDAAHLENQSIVVSSHDLNLHQVAVGDLRSILQKDQDEISLLSKDYDRALVALQSGGEAIENAVWNLKEQRKLIDDGTRDEKMERDNSHIENKIRELETEERIVSTRLGPGHHQVKVLRDEIQRWKDDLAANINGTSDQIADTSVEPEVVLQRYVTKQNQLISDLRTRIDVNSKKMAMHAEEAGRIRDVTRRVEDIKLQMAGVREFIQAAERRLIEADSGDNNTRQEGFHFQHLQNATHGKEIWPILAIILGIGGILGSLAGFGLGCLVELADKTFHNPDEIMKQLNVPLIGHVPVIGQSKRYLVENSLIEPIVCTYHRPKSQVSEAFRAVRTALYFNTQGKNHSVIQVTSPTPGDGKSTLASNLAVSIAQSGKRILLVDADMRRPRQHGTFGISSKVGFATVLSGQSQWRDVMYECEEIEGLTVMPCGAKPNNPAELSSSPQVKVLIEEMRAEFDFVIIDTPPLLAVTDPCPIAARVDGVILCLRIKKNVRVSAERATEMISNLGATCIGLVVNGVGAQSGYGSQYTYGAYRAGYSYNGYGYGYGYGTGGGKYYDEDKKGRKANIAPPKHIESTPSDQSRVS